MNEERKPIEFENKSLVNKTQLKVMQKLGAYFKIPQKMLRAALDEDSAKDDNVLRFPQLADIFDAEFYPVSYKIKMQELLNETKFLKSDLWAMYVQANDKGVFTIVDPGVISVLVDFGSVDGIKGIAGIYLEFKEMSTPLILLSLDTYLNIFDPLPAD